MEEETSPEIARVIEVAKQGGYMMALLDIKEILLKETNEGNMSSELLCDINNQINQARDIHFLMNMVQPDLRHEG